MDYKRILVVQDISCVGQCSLTVALPILSACGHETAILPSAVLSTHTGGFHGYTFRDLTDDLPAICRHWQSEGLMFDALYTGYLGNMAQVDTVETIMEHLIRPGGVRVVDPAMADNGRLYAGFDDAYVAAMRRLCTKADIILPNITEAALLTGLPYREQYDTAYIDELIAGLHHLGASNIVLTGVSFLPDTLGVLVCAGEHRQYHAHRRIPRMFHGTGDIYASAFVGAYLHGKSMSEAARIAVDFTLASIENTVDAPEHWYGVRYEPMIPRLIEEFMK